VDIITGFLFGHDKKWKYYLLIKHLLHYILKMQHTSDSILIEKLSNVTGQLSIGGHYYHYKNPSQNYKVIDVVLCEATEEPLVIYKALHSGITWSRPYSSWCENITPDITRFSAVPII